MEYKLFESFLTLNEDHTDLKLLKADEYDFGDNEQDTRDLSVTLEDEITGVVYAVDFKLVNGTEVNITTIDIQDKPHSRNTGEIKTQSGNEVTADLVKNYIYANLKMILSVAEHYG